MKEAGTESKPIHKLRLRKAESMQMISEKTSRGRREHKQTNPPKNTPTCNILASSTALIIMSNQLETINPKPNMNSKSKNTTPNVNKAGSVCTNFKDSGYFL